MSSLRTLTKSLVVLALAAVTVVPAIHETPVAKAADPVVRVSPDRVRDGGLIVVYGWNFKPNTKVDIEVEDINRVVNVARNGTFKDSFNIDVENVGNKNLVACNVLTAICGSDIFTVVGG